MRPTRNHLTAAAGLALLLCLGGCDAITGPGERSLTVFGTYQWDDGTPVVDLWLQAGSVGWICDANCDSWSTSQGHATWTIWTSTYTDQTGSYELTWKQDCEGEHEGISILEVAGSAPAGRQPPAVPNVSCTFPDADHGLTCTSSPQERNCVIARP